MQGEGQREPQVDIRVERLFSRVSLPEPALSLQPFWNANWRRCELLITIECHVCPPRPRVQEPLENWV